MGTYFDLKYSIVCLAELNSLWGMNTSLLVGGAHVSEIT